MYKDFTAHLISGRKDIFQSLAEAESRIEDAKRSRNKDARNLAERDARDLRRSLAVSIPAAAVAFLDATKLSKVDEVRAEWQKLTAANPDTGGRAVEDEWHLAELVRLFELPQVQVIDLPQLSFLISFTFTLAKPYISRDEDTFYVIDNPVRKDKIFRLPFVAASTYKGSLRSTARYVLRDTSSDGFDGPTIEKLFGTDKRRASEELHSGRLWCFPTLFKSTGLEVINPHLRTTGAGDRPIFFETATGAGRFNLLYIPLDLSTTPHEEVAADIKSIARVVKAMFTEYGVGAKTSSGFGIAKEQLVGGGRLLMKIGGLPKILAEESNTPPTSAPAGLPQYLKTHVQLKDEFLDDSGRLMPEGEYETRLKKVGREYNKKSRQMYEKARGWWEREQQKLSKEEVKQSAQEARPKSAATPPVQELTFNSFGELVREAEKLSKALERIGGQA